MNVSPIIVLDFETTGVSPEAGDRITEVAALRIVEGEITERFVSLINCGVNVPYYITKLTGITQDMVNHAPLVEVVIPSLLDFIGTDPLLAHNAGFDEKFSKSRKYATGIKSITQWTHLFFETCSPYFTSSTQLSTWGNGRLI